MTFGQFLGEIKAGRGMAAVERESNRLGARKIVRGARLGLKVASQVLPGKYGEMAGAANSALGKVEGAAETAKKVGTAIERTSNAARSGDVAGTVSGLAAVRSQGMGARAKYRKK
jgi:hypothetical protein